MRSVDSCSSAARLARGQRRRDPAQRGVGRRARRARATRSSQRLVDAGRGERLGEPPRLGDAELLERARAARPRRRRRRARRARVRAAARASACALQRDELARPRSRSMPGLDEARRSSSRCTSSASASCAAARRAAAAGLLSSCARPAAIVPSEASRSRFCSIAVMRLITGATCCITRRCTARLREREPAEVLGCDQRQRGTSVSACMRTPSGAAGERGDRAHPGRRVLAADRLAAVAVDDRAPAPSPSSSSCTPGGSARPARR